MEKVRCEYCKILTTKIQLKRHQNSKLCRNKQQNINVLLPLQDYKCKHCDRRFNRLDNKIDHENNKSCDVSNVIIKYNEIIKQRELEIGHLKMQLEMSKDVKGNANVIINNNAININNISIDFSDISKNLDKFDIYTLSDHTFLINFLMTIFHNKIILTNECKKTITYSMNNKTINDIKCKRFLCNSANELMYVAERICNQNNKNIDDTVTKKANKNKVLLGSISTEKGMKNGVRTLDIALFIDAVVKYLKDNNITDIKAV